MDVDRDNIEIILKLVFKVVGWTYLAENREQ